MSSCRAKLGLSSKWPRLYLASIGAALVVVGCAKVYSGSGSARILQQPDPVLLASNRLILLAAALAEFGVVSYLMLGVSTARKFIVVIWLAGLFCVYRIGLWWLAPGAPCPCLGTITERLPLSPSHINFALKCFLAYMLCGSVYFLLRNRDLTTSVDVTRTPDCGISVID